MKPPYERFVRPVEGTEYPSEYDLKSALIIDPIERTTAPINKVTLDLTTARLPSDPYVIIQPGRAFVPYFFETGTVSKLRALTGSMNVRVNDDRPDKNIFCVNNRGYRGGFIRLYLSWIAQPGISVDFITLRSWREPWMVDG